MTKIEWTEKTWNPIAGCSVVSPGCTNCYAMKQAPRLAANPATPQYAGTVQNSKGGPVWTGKIGIASNRVLTQPLRRKKPTMYFVNSMSDLFHENVPDAADGYYRTGKLDWVIVGGESGNKARPMHPDWARSLRDQCVAAGVPFFMKQMGGTQKPFAPIPDDLMIREFPNTGGRL